jgi:hypothetical protein
MERSNDRFSATPPGEILRQGFLELRDMQQICDLEPIRGRVEPMIEAKSAPPALPSDGNRLSFMAKQLRNDAP